MKKEHIPYYISILSLIVSGIAIGVSFYRTENLSVDYMGVIVGILSLLVTALLTWNIYTVIDVKSIKEDYKELKARIDTEKKRLRDYVDIVQNFTMGNVRMTENKYGEALGLYCNAAIELNRMIGEYGLNRKSEELDLMYKVINNAKDIVKNEYDITGSELLKHYYKKIIEGLKGIKYKNTKMIETYIEVTYNQDDTTSNIKNE